MRWAVWDKSKERGDYPRIKSLGSRATRYADREEVELELVHWAPEKECRVVSVKVDNEGGVTVEHSTSEGQETGLDIEDIRRVYIPGWGE